MNTCKNCGGHNVKVTENPSRTNYYCNSCGSRRKPVMGDVEIATENVRLAKKAQKLQDTNRIERKAFREHARVENAYTEYVKEIDLFLKRYGSRLHFNERVSTPPVEAVRKGEVGFVQLTDHHLNELVDLPHNKYDITIASKRLMLLAHEAIWMFSVRGITNVVVEFGGDLLNSDRRLDELLSQATNRAKATIIAVELYTAFLRHLSEIFNLTVISVLGNESRADKEMLWGNDVASNNYDYTIVAMVKKLIEESDATNIAFGPIDQYETVVDINGHKVLMTHDIQKFTDTQVKTQSTIGRYYLSGNPIDCIVSGHVHANKTSVFSYRGGSLVGSNSYNEVSLGLLSRASQQIGFFGKGYRNFVSIDLQNTEGIEGYPVSDSFMAYNAKSNKKNEPQTTVFKVVI